MKDPNLKQMGDENINPLPPQFYRVHEGQEAYMKELEKLNSHQKRQNFLASNWRIEDMDPEGSI